MEYINFALFTPKLPPFGVGGHIICNVFFLSLLMLRTKFGQVWPSSSWEDVNGRRTTDDGRRTTDDDRRQPIEIGHLSHSCELMMLWQKIFFVKVNNCLNINEQIKVHIAWPGDFHAYYYKLHVLEPSCKTCSKLKQIQINDKDKILIEQSKWY